MVVAVFFTDIVNIQQKIFLVEGFQVKFIISKAIIR